MLKWEVERVTVGFGKRGRLVTSGKWDVEHIGRMSSSSQNLTMESGIELKRKNTIFALPTKAMGINGDLHETQSITERMQFVHRADIV